MTAGRDFRVWTWALPCVAWLIFGAALRWPTLDALPNYLSEASGRLAYSDIVVFYAPDNPAPYLQRDLEYPVVTGLTLWLTGFMPGGIKGYFLVNALVMSGALLGCFAYLARLGPPVRIAWFALAPGLAFYSVLNWDALGLLGLVAAVYYLRRRRYGWSGASLAFGTSAKLFPMFVLPVLLAYTLRRDIAERGAGNSRDRRNAVFSPASRRFLAGFAAILLALNLPLAMFSPRGWSYFLRFQAGRSSNLDSIWTHVPTIPDQAQSLLFALLFLVGTAWLSLRVWRGGRWEIAALLSLLLFLLFTKVYSPQYDLWLLPMLALTACPMALWLAFILADGVYYWAIFYFYFVYAGGDARLGQDTAEMLVGVSVWLREFVLGLLFVWGLRRFAAGSRSAARSARFRDFGGTDHARELKQLRGAVEKLQAEVAALQSLQSSREGSKAGQRQDKPP